jgi:hypothetical protein
MGAIRRIFALQPGAGPVEYAVVAAGVFLAISAVILTQWSAVN